MRQGRAEGVDGRDVIRQKHRAVEEDGTTGMDPESLRSFAPPSGLPAISPSRGEIKLSADARDLPP